ncbi:MAG TPA: PA14 domain-containing protein [Saprospiraceae bacterium]|nr:PA14 domain-containing protein [Saprospiraceae bacterium]HMQ82959.1 PA14 domain-containing protein [Saprospiraceae bacterium]
MKPDQALWYYRRIQLDQSQWLQLNADDGAQVFFKEQSIKTADGKYFLLPATTDSVDLYVRVLNNAVFGGLRAALLHDERPVTSVACKADLPWPYVQESEAAYIVKWLRPGAELVKLRYAYDRGTVQELEPKQQEGDLYQFEIPKQSGRILYYAFSNKGYWSDSFSLNIAPRDSTLQFGIWADSQGGWPVFEALAQQMFAKNIAFSVGVGDLTPNGRDTCQWKHLIQAMGKKAAEVPTYFIPGNHDYDHYYDDLIPRNYQHYIREDNFFTWTASNAVFLALDPNETFPIGIKGEQRRWLKKQLRSKTWKQARWRFLFIHHPPYSSEENDHGNTYIGASTFATQARNLVPLYEAYGVDFCLFGHTHIYERTWPIFNNTVNQKDGVIYINSGGAGGGLEDFDPTRSWFSLEMQKTHHYCTFAIFDKTLVFKAIDHDGKLFDTFQMQKEETNSGTQGNMMQPPAPHFELDQLIFQKETQVGLNAFDPSLRIVFTTDGSEPDLQSTLYDRPITISESLTLKARAYTQDDRASRVVERKFSKMAPMPAVKTGKTQVGLAWKYYEGTWDFLPDFKVMHPLKTGVAASVSEAGIFQQDNHFAIVFEGYVDLVETATYTFFTRSDDGSKLYIDDKLAVDNDGQHGAFYEYGDIILEKGRHKLRIEYFESSGSQMLQAGIVDEVLGRVPFHPGQLSY